MVKKAKGRKNHSAEILDDNGTLIAGASARGADEGKAPANAVDSPESGFSAAVTDKKGISQP